MKRNIFILILMIMLIFVGCGSGEENSVDSGMDSVTEESSFSEPSETESAVFDESSGEISRESGEGSVESEEESDETSESEISEPESSEDDKIADTGLAENPLTGLYNITEGGVGKRPVAIMVNNIEYSLPQYGIASADIIFEMPAEGGITRFMAMYGDYTAIPRVCSIRSCRKYFPAISEGFDAVYVNCGMNDIIRDYVSSLNLTNYDAYFDSRLFARDQNRLNGGYAYEHTLYFDGPKLPEIMAADGKRTDIESDKTGTFFNFNERFTTIAPSDTKCEYVKVDFGANKSGFTYDAASDKYYKDFNGNAQIDGKTETQLSFTNLIILETEIGADENGLHREVNWHGGSGHYGYYISNGFVQKITWSKASEESKLMLYDLEGNPLYINRGNMYIAIGYKGETEIRG